MEYILHIDTSTDKSTVAICGDGKPLAFRNSEEARNHAGSINLMINEVMAQANIKLVELSAIAACGGPGSYTGLRIGVATAKGLCYALNKPLLLDNRLTLLSYQAYLRKEIAATHYISLLTAREKEYFISVHDSDFNCIIEPKHITYTELDELMEGKENICLTTDVNEEILNALHIEKMHLITSTDIDLASWAGYSYQSFKCNNTVNLSEAEPFYLKQVFTHK